MTMTAIASSAPSIAEARSLTGLVQIFEPSVQLCHLPRPVDRLIDAYLQAAALRMGQGLRQVVEIRQGFSAAHLPDLPGRQALVNDIDFLLALYGDLLDCAHAVLRLEVINRAMCPRFHVDHTGIRLLCTYRGPGTEWLEEGCANRSKLGHGARGQADEHSGLVIDPNGIGHVAPHAIALLKGDLWQDNTGRGAIHRSPAVTPEAAPRVLLALDAVWD
jgi:hypothetical protein